MTPTLPSYAAIARKSSSNDMNNNNNQSTPIERITSLFRPVSKLITSNSKLTSNNSDLKILNLNEANSTPTTTPKRRKRQTKKRINHNLFDSINHSQKYKHLLISGYVRYNFKPRYFPKDLINLMLSLYDEVIIWKMKNLKKFRSMKNGSAIYGPKFELTSLIQFETTLCPNGWKINQYGSTQFYIELKSIPNYIKSITVYYELACIDTQSMCKKIRIFKKSTDAQSWGTNNMRLSECDSFNNELQFASYVKLLRIEYRKNYTKNNIIYFEKMILNEITRYEWNINQKLLSKFKNCEMGKFYYSSNFGNNSFCIELAPNGWHKTNKGKLMFYLRLLSLPLNIKQIKCDCKFTFIHDNNSNTYYYQHSFSYQIHGLQWHSLQDSMNELKSSKYNDLKFCVEIKIIKVIDMNDNEIPYDQWTDYDIVCK